MARQPKPWYRKDRKVWCVTIDGVRHNLGRTKREAMEQFRLLHSDGPPPRERVVATPLASIVDEFLDWVHRNRSAATYEWYRCRLQEFIEIHPQLAVEMLRPYHVEKWAATAGPSPTSRRNHVRSVKRCLKWAVSQGYLTASPIADMEVPASRARDAYLPPDEFQALLPYVRDPNFLDLLVVTYETGCRPQESLRVEARHADLKNQRWVFPAKEAKVKSMPRVVYLSTTAAEVTERLMKLHPTGPLFRTRSGRAWNKDSVGCAFDRLNIRIGRKVLRSRNEAPSTREIADFAESLPTHRTMRGVVVPKSEADLRSEAKQKLIDRMARQASPRWSLYALRHSWATNALQNGVDALTVAILMGHKDPSTLARTYQHLSHNPAHLLAESRRALA